VRTGSVSGYRVEPAAADGRGGLATFWPLPRRWFRKVLVRVDGGVALPVALVPPVLGEKHRLGLPGVG
jgi:hypothetical protein